MDEAPDSGTECGQDPGYGFPGEKGKIIQALNRN